MQGGRALLVGLLLALILLAAPAQGQALAEVFDVDDAYEATLRAGGELRFEWLVYNRQSVDLLVQARVDPPSGDAWEARTAPGYAILAPGAGLNVTLTVSATEDLRAGEALLTIRFEVAQAADPAVAETHTRAVSLTLVPIPAAVSQENKILGLVDNPLPYPMNTRIATFVISVALWAIIAVAIVLVATPVLRSYVGRTETELDETLLSIIRGPLLALILAYGAVQSLAILQPPRDILNLLSRTYSAALILIATWLAYRVFRGVVIEWGRRMAARRDTPLFDRVWPVLNKVGAILILVVGASALAGAFGLDLTAFIAGMGVLGIVIALAAQESLSNFFSGMFLLLDRPFKEGDLVEINGDRCRIEQVGLRSTRVYHRPSHKVLVIPNNKLAREMIVNLVQPDQSIRQETTVGVAYGSDVERVKEALVSAASNHPGVIADDPQRAPFARLEEFADSALLFKMKFWVRDADQLMRVRGEVNEAIVRALADAGIEIPFPQRRITIQREESLPEDLERG